MLLISHKIQPGVAGRFLEKWIPTCAVASTGRDIHVVRDVWADWRAELLDVDCRVDRERAVVAVDRYPRGVDGLRGRRAGQRGERQNDERTGQCKYCFPHVSGSHSRSHWGLTYGAGPGWVRPSAGS